MPRTKALWLSLLLMLPPGFIPLLPSLNVQAQETRKRIAVLDFDYSGVNTPYVSSFAGVGAGRGISDLLINALVKDGTYVVLERSKLDAVLREQNLAQGGRVQPGTEAQLGRLLGVDALLFGSITKFNIERRESGGSIGFFGIGGSSKQTKVLVQVNARLVSTSTAEILAVADGNGEQEQSDSSVSVMGIGGGSSTNNDDTLLSNATTVALDKMTPQLIAVAPKLTTFLDVAFQAVIADVTGNLLTLNKGSESGVKVGSKLAVERVIKTVKDPTTGNVLRQLTSPIGSLTITEASIGSSLGTVTSGKGFKIGDVAKFPTTVKSITGTITPSTSP